MKYKLEQHVQRSNTDDYVSHFTIDAALCKISRVSYDTALAGSTRSLLPTGRGKDLVGIISAMHLHASQREGHALSGSGGRAAGEGRGGTARGTRGSRLEAASCRRTGSAVCTTFVLHQFPTKQTTF